MVVRRRALWRCQLAVVPGRGYTSPIVAMRTELDPTPTSGRVSAPVSGAREGVDCVVFRENTECLYVRRERTGTSEKDGKGHRRAPHHRAGVAAHRQDAFEAGRPAGLRPRAAGQGHDRAQGHPARDRRPSASALDVAASDERYKALTVEEQLVDSRVYRLYKTPEVRQERARAHVSVSRA